MRENPNRKPILWCSGRIISSFCDDKWTCESASDSHFATRFSNKKGPSMEFGAAGRQKNAEIGPLRCLAWRLRIYYRTTAIGQFVDHRRTTSGVGGGGGKKTT